MEQTVATSPPRNDSAHKLSIVGRSVVAQMSSWIRAAKQIIFVRTGNLDKSFGADITNFLDIDRISKQLGVEERALADGKSDQPRPDSELMLGTQQEIVVYFKELQRKAHYQVAEFTRKFCELGEKIDLAGTRSRIGDVPSRCENRIHRLIAESQSQLNILAERGNQQQQVLEKSGTTGKKEQGDAKGASGVIRFFYLVMLVAAGAFAIKKFAVPLVDAATQVNGNVGAAVGAPLPDIAGVFPPTWVVSSMLVVVIASFLLARILAFFADQATLERRAMRWLGAATGIAVVTMLAFLAANYTAASMVGPGASILGLTADAVADWTSLFVNLKGGTGLVIFLLAGTLAFIVGYGRDDEAVSFEDRKSDFEQTRRQREQLTKRLRRQINSIVDSADAEVSTLMKQLKSLSSKYSGFVEAARRIPASLSDYDVALEDGCNILLDRYRSTNRRVRRSDVPTSFDEHICFRPETTPDFAVFRDEERRLELIREGIVELENEAVKVRQALRDLNSRSIGALEEMPSPG